MTRLALVASSSFILLWPSTPVASPDWAASVAPCEAAINIPRPGSPSDVRVIRGEATEDEEPETDVQGGPRVSMDEAESLAVAPGSHDYYDALTERSDCLKAYSLRNDAQLRKYSASRSAAQSVTYDPARDTDPNRQDAAKIVIPPDRNSLRNQVHLPLGTADGNTYLFTWDGFWTESYLPSLTGLTSHKTFNLCSPDDAIWLETRTRFDGGFGDDRPAEFDRTRHISTVDLRSYNSQAGLVDLGSNITNIHPLAPQRAQFIVKPNVWTRFWVLVDQRAVERGLDPISVWVADETRDPVQLLDRLKVQVRDNPNSIDIFRLEYNTSKDEIRAGRAPMVAYARNFVMLRNVANVSSVLQRPVR